MMDQSGVDSAHFLIGREFLGKYRVLQQIDDGRSPIQRFTVQNLIMDSRAEMLLMTQGDLDDETWRQLVEEYCAEGSRLEEIASPNITPVFSAGVIEGLPFLVTTARSAQTIANLGETAARPDPDMLVSLIMQVGEALVEAHRRGIIHGNLTPDNVELLHLEGKSSRVAIRELGLVHFLSRGRSDLAQLTKTGRTLADPQYMAPELFTGKTPDVRSDIYSFGALCYGLCCGRPPFAGAAKVMDLMLAHLNESPPPFDEQALAADLPPFLEPWIGEMLQKDPVHRPTDLDEHLARLYMAARGFSAIEEELVQPAVAPLPELGKVNPRARRRSRSKRKRELVSGILAALAIAMPVLLLILILVARLRENMPSYQSQVPRGPDAESPDSSLAAAPGGRSIAGSPQALLSPSLGRFNLESVKPSDRRAPETGNDRSAPPDEQPPAEILLLGVTVKQISEPMARELKLRDRRGLYVVSIRPGSPAEHADLRVGDIVKKSETKGENILTWKPNEVVDPDDLRQAVNEAIRRGSRLALSVKRASYEGLLIFVSFSGEDQAESIYTHRR